jgi:hypothetical protein
MWWGKTAGMLAAFQGFHTPHGGKKTRQDVQVILGQLLMYNNCITSGRLSLGLLPGSG